jgi:prolyl-tRNA editing enzyme YbaK/EbsC (Cys-tRNA(Pro) deacylase)
VPEPVRRRSAPPGGRLVGVHPTVARVVGILTSAGWSGEVRVLPDSARTAAEAATGLCCDVGAIASSLVFIADGEPLLVLTSGAHRVDTRAVAARLGVGAVERAPASLVREATGYAIGGVAPVGHPQPLRTLVDVDLSRHDVVWAAAGHPHAVFPTTYEELLRLTGGTSAEVAG